MAAEYYSPELGHVGICASRLVMPSSLTQDHCKTLHVLATAPQETYVSIINQNNQPLIAALIEIISNIHLFCDPLQKVLIANLRAELTLHPKKRVELLLEFQSLIQQLLSFAFKEALIAEVVLAVINHGSCNESNSG